MRSVAAWGSIPRNLPRPGNKVLLTQTELKAGIGIDYDEATKEVKVAVVFYAESEKVPFTKKATYELLRTCLHFAYPNKIIFKGTWNGDPNKVKVELFAALTGFFRDAVENTSAVAPFDPDHLPKSVRITRNKAYIPYIRAACIGWMIANGATSDPNFLTSQNIALDGEEYLSWVKERFDQFTRIRTQTDFQRKALEALKKVEAEGVAKEVENDPAK